MSDDILSLEVSVLNLVKRFIARQQLTLEAFQTLRPAIVEADLINLNEKKLIEILNGYIDAPWYGHWREWSYTFQGKGCRLIHRQTSEIIEWEAPNINTFDRYWFVNWLEWLWMFHPDDRDLSLLKDFYSHRPNRYDLYHVIFPMLRLLSIEGYMGQHPRSKNQYTLVTNSQSVDVA